MTLNKTLSKLPTDLPLPGGIGNAFGQPCSFMLPTQHQTGALLKGPILATSEVAITGNVVITIDPLSKTPSGTLTVAGVTTLNGVVNVNAATNIVGAVNITGAVNVTGAVTATSFSGTINVQPWKSFDIRHPNKEDGDSDMSVLRVQRLQCISGANWMEIILLKYQTTGRIGRMGQYFCKSYSIR